MAVLLTESFDVYGSLTDVSGKWAVTYISGQAPALSTSLTAFGVGQCLYGGGAFSGSSGVLSSLISPNWGSNETTIYGSVRTKWNNGSAQASGYLALEFLDGSNIQCTIRFNGDGSINLYSGAPTGTLLGSYTGQFSLNTSDSWQFKIVINNTTGSIELRKNGGSTDVISLTGVNTRAGSTNAYANALGIVMGQTGTGTPYFAIDDILLNSASGAAPTSWPGDIRALQQTPAGVVQAQFSVSPSAASVQYTTSTGFTNASPANQAQFSSVTASYSGTVSATFLNVAAGATGHVKMAIYDATGAGGGPGALLSVSNEITNPAAGLITFTHATPPTVTKGAVYWVAYLHDMTLNVYGASASVWDVQSVTYSSGFPSTAAASNTSVNGGNYQGMTITPSNAAVTSETVEDGDTSYVYSSTVGQEDIYTLSAVPTTYSIVGVEYYAVWKKSDAGPRTAQLSVAANGSADTAEITASTLSAGTYAYASKFLALDPTGAAFTPSNANGAHLGISVTA